MKIIKPSATLLEITPKAERLIEQAGRTCYKYEDRITSDSSAQFIHMILKRGHDSVLEHASATIRFVCDRGVSHEMVRHRLASYSQESTRYCDYAGGVKFIMPPGVDQNEFSKMATQSENNYKRLRAKGLSPQIARGVLLISLKTEIVMSANFREWRHFLRLRCAKAAHPQMREVAIIAYDLLQAECPAVFSGIGIYEE